ncbi:MULTISPECIES: phycobilisome linker polypeptide [Synechocystis]|uniref:Phycobilisome linker polypeptide n=1 Tax=Synechocystis salina LEGE 00031 TaxID=1828736 RepID=A0ABR9VN70_9SYNC|nr:MULTISPECIES: phycobilisome linker polypeptide [Synechocystis]MBD2653208.1 phycobilisome linker polypeptide [Synechocystis sp. FACHB-383]MBE9194134.1 phycobilisome linker polypeptide [Synechocystis sp. LEGE 06083]MBE9241186.1 phycobilisome linker polypeptide [Synechocystis salina LEGE 00041]MBE9252794.1 phycobilisome linker polypeptide [Synechocystis salina LEGE 00031]
MLGQSSLVGYSNTQAANRVFVYEISGLRQTDASENINHDIRRSGSVFIKVPYARMNEEMRRISRLGGTIVNIRPYQADSNEDN